jgi:hypothetical protein
MVRATGIDAAASPSAMPSPSASAATSIATSSPSSSANARSSRVAAASPAGTNEPAGAIPLDARTLAMRAIGREIDGDHEGALADLRTALDAASDIAQRARIERLLQGLGGSR